MKNLFKILILISFSLSVDCVDSLEIKLWDKCYSIENTIRIEVNGIDEIPSDIGKLKNLKYLFLGNTGFEDDDFRNKIRSIPSEIKNLKNLILLRLERNQIQTIPPEVGELINLEYLSLSSNQLKGEIPSFIWEMTNLVRLELNNNQLSGSISSDIGKLDKLEFLNLKDNQLSGKIPLEVLDLKNIYFFHLSNNQLTGKVPLGLQKWWEDFNSFDISGNQFDGEIYPVIKKYDDDGKLFLEKYRTGSNQQKWIKYHKNGQKWYEGEYEKYSFYKGKEKTGVFTEWYESGKIKQIETYTGCTYISICYYLKQFSYYGNGQMKIEKNYIVKEGSPSGYGNTGKHKDGKWVYYNENGGIIKEEVWVEGKLIETIEY